MRRKAMYHPLRTAAFSILITFALSTSAFAGAGDWLNSAKAKALRSLQASISRPDAVRGSVVASPQKRDPDYYFHWVRDAALAIDPLVTHYSETHDSDARTRILEYIEFSRSNQKSKALTGLGEPKFNVDGTAYSGPWGRPQNDGPALRAITLTRFARIALKEGQSEFVRARLYDSKLPSDSLIKTDLEYVAHHWRDPSFDLWEEVLGDHFYTRMVQRRALIDGARLADELGDAGAASFYRGEAAKLSVEIEKHATGRMQTKRKERASWIVPTLNKKSGVDKPAMLDMAVILGALHGDAGDGFYDVKNQKVQATLRKIITEFKILYPINHGSTPGVLIGRYPEDTYSGGAAKLGNPWVLLTLACAEASYKMGAIAAGDTFIDHLAQFAGPNSGLSEQIDRSTGQMTSARDLTWNYAAVLTAQSARLRRARR